MDGVNNRCPFGKTYYIKSEKRYFSGKYPEGRAKGVSGYENGVRFQYRVLWPAKSRMQKVLPDFELKSRSRMM